MSAGGFASQIAQFSQKTQDKLTRTRKGVTIKLFSAVIYDSPVLTGRFRGNWQMTQGAPATGNLDLVDKNGAPTVNAMAAAVDKSNNSDAVFLTNNLPYGPRLEYDGWSDKAKDGMVRKNVARFDGLIKVEVESQNR